MMTCDAVAALVDRWQNGGTPRPEALREAGRHVASCRACRASCGALLPLMMRDAGIPPAPEPPPGFEEKVMRAVRDAGVPGRARHERRGRVVALVAAAMVLVFGITGVVLLRAGSAGRDGMLTVTFVLDTPEAHSVALVGDFTGWQPGGYQLERRPSDGKWAITVRLKPDRSYVYDFLIDGTRWVTDPSAGTIDDGFGGSDSILRL